MSIKQEPYNQGPYSRPYGSPASGHVSPAAVANADKIELPVVGGKVVLAGGGRCVEIKFDGTVIEALNELGASVSLAALGFSGVGIIDSHDVSGGAVSSVQLDPGAALEVGDMWLLVGSIAQAAGSSYYLEFNEDTTLTNYYSQVFQSSNAIGSNNRTNDPLFCVVSAGDDATFISLIRRSASGRTRTSSFVDRDDAANTALRLNSHIWNTTTDPVTVEVVAATVGGIGDGSWFRLFRVIGT